MRRTERTYLFYYIILLAGLAMSFSSCSNTKYLAKGQRLLVSNKVEVHGDLLNTEKENIRNDLSSSSIIMQAPNYKTLRIARLKLWLYNQKNKEKKSSKFWDLILIPKNIEPPVIYDSTKMLQTVENMQNYMINQGYFHASVNADKSEKHRKIKVDYSVNTGKNFIIDSIGYDIPDTAIRRIIVNHLATADIKKGDPYKISGLIDERNRLTDLVRNAGYYKFSQDYVTMEVDTVNKDLFQASIDPFESVVNLFNANVSKEHPTLELTIHVNAPSDSVKPRRYRLSHIYVYPDYDITSDETDTTQKEVYFHGLTIRYRRPVVKPYVLRRAIYFHPGDYYSQKSYTNTINKLNELGVFKFVTVQASERSDSAYLLNYYIYLVPEKRQSIGADIEATTSTGDYVLGTGLNINYSNRNVNRSANSLSLSLKGGVETNFDDNRNLYIQAKDLGAQLNMTFPRFITPFHIREASRFTNAKTNLALGYNHLDRINFFTLNTVNGSFGYSWNETDKKKWIFQPFAFDYTRATNISDTFQAQLDNNPFLKSSFAKTFTGGINTSFIYNNQSALNPTESFDYFRASLDESGILLGGLNLLLKGVSGGNTDFQKLTSLPFSHYVKLETEYKHYFVRPHADFVTRVLAGVGVPYSSSDVLPYIKSFTAGGPNSMRAWRLRTLGPGGYKDPDLGNRDKFIDQTGEMKLEGNVEYRFDILKLFAGSLFLRGAIFTDVGNIWNLHNDPNKPYSQFELNKMYRELAIGSGVGLRLDFSYFVFRFDVATPIKTPYISDPNNGWVVDKINFGSRQWRRDNLVYNIAVGYPF